MKNSVHRDDPAGSGWLRQLAGHRRGSVTLLAAAMFTVLIALAGLVVEYGLALTTKAQYQRIADLAADAGANAYLSSPTTSALDDAVNRVATLNGISASLISAQLVTSPTNDGNKAVQVTVSSNSVLSLVSVLTGSKSLNVSASAYAELKVATPSCITALNTAGTGIILSGGTTITTSNCSVNSNNTVAAPYGTKITTSELTYDTTASLDSVTLQDIVAPAGGTLTITQAQTSDPFAGNTAVKAEVTHVGTLSSLTAPSAPSVSSATAMALGWYPTTLTVGSCKGTLSGSTWTVTCTEPGPFNLGTISLGGGLNLNFNVNGQSTDVYNIAGDINASSGDIINFGPGTYNVSGGIIVGGGVTVSFGAGTFNLGVYSSSCNKVKGYSICDTGTSLTIAGSSTFSLAGGIYVGGGSLLALGTSAIGDTSPTSNSFSVGKAADGNSVNLGGGGSLTLADATGAGDLFQATGNLLTAGGSCLLVSAAAQHDIAGSINAAGGVVLGAGDYSVAGYVALGAGSGGNVTCTVNGQSQSVGLSGTNVSFGIGGTTTSNVSPCTGTLFCVAAGYSDVTMTAPSTGTMQGLLVIGPTSTSNNAGASFAEGASDTNLSGAFYVPYGPITLSGAASVGGSDSCLELIGSQITESGGSALASVCATQSAGSTATATALLVQ